MLLFISVASSIPVNNNHHDGPVIYSFVPHTTTNNDRTARKVFHGGSTSLQEKVGSLEARLTDSAWLTTMMTAALATCKMLLYFTRTVALPAVGSTAFLIVGTPLILVFL